MAEQNNKPTLLVLNDPHAMRINKELAQEIGFENSIVLLQIEFLIRTSNNLREGKYWTYQSLKELHAVFPWWSETTISRIIKDLLENKFIVIGNFNKTRLDRTQWFALNEEGISKLKSVQLLAKSQVSPIFQNEKCILQNEKCMSPKCKIHVAKMKNACRQNEPTIPETLLRDPRDIEEKEIAEQPSVVGFSEEVFPSQEKNTSKQVGTKTKKVVDPRASHRAIQAVRAITNRYPDKLVWDDIIALLGDTPNIEQLTLCAKAWARKSTNMGNLDTWLFDWYKNGLPLELQKHFTPSTAVTPDNDPHRWPTEEELALKPPGLAKEIRRLKALAGDINNPRIPKGSLPGYH